MACPGDGGGAGGAAGRPAGLLKICPAPRGAVFEGNVDVLLHGSVVRDSRVVVRGRRAAGRPGCSRRLDLVDAHAVGPAWRGLVPDLVAGPANAARTAKPGRLDAGRRGRTTQPRGGRAHRDRGRAQLGGVPDESCASHQFSTNNYVAGRWRSYP